MLGEHVSLFLYTVAIKQSAAEKIQEGIQK